MRDWAVMQTKKRLRECEVVCWCIQDDEAHRPSMSEVVQILEGITEVNLPPILRFLYFYNDNQDDVIFFTESPSRKSYHAQSNVSIAFP